MMKRIEAIKKIGKLYGIEIENKDILHVGILEKNRKDNELFNETINTYNLLMYNLYANKVTLNNVDDIYVNNNTIYFDLKNGLPGYYLKNLFKEEL